MTSRRTIVLSVALVSIAMLAGLAPQAARSGTDEQVQARTLKVDPVHSSSLFRIKHNGIAWFYGRFNEMSGTVRYAEGGDDLHVDLSIPVESIDTGAAGRDRHLKSPDFFNAREFPEMSFTTKSSSKVSDNIYEVTGDLTIHGVTKPVTAKVEATGCEEIKGDQKCGFETIFDIKRTDFDMGYMVGGGLSDEVRVIVSLEVTE